MEFLLVDHNNEIGWPPYQTGPRDSIFALGVASVNYARLEFAMQAILGNVIGSLLLSSIVMPKVGNDVRIKIARQMLPSTGWPKNIIGLVTDFLDAFDTLSENRNLLMHSNLVAGTQDQIALYKTNRAGDTILCQIPSNDLRQVADDLRAYFLFGIDLSNWISFQLLGLSSALGLTGGEPHPLPKKPPAPRKLDYTPQPVLPVDPPRRTSSQA